MNTKEQFIEQFNKVFDDNNHVKLCGRTECIKLITIADKLEVNIKHGNMNNGIIDIDKMLNLRNKYIL